MLLDVAHDAEAIYQFLNHGQVKPIIDLNARTKKLLERVVIFKFHRKVCRFVP